MGGLYLDAWWPIAWEHGGQCCGGNPFVHHIYLVFLFLFLDGRTDLREVLGPRGGPRRVAQFLVWPNKVSQPIKA